MTTLKQSSKNSVGHSSSDSSPFQDLPAYFAGLKTEWTKISWPSKAQVWAQTIVVLVMVSMMTLILFIMDYSFHLIISSIVPHRI